jgi:hypothetical protein
MCSVGCKKCQFLFGVEITEEIMSNEQGPESDLKIIMKKHTVNPFEAMDYAVEFGQICNCYLSEPECKKIWPDPMLARGNNHHMWNKILGYSAYTSTGCRYTDWLIFYNSLDPKNQTNLLCWVKKKMDKLRET